MILPLLTDSHSCPEPPSSDDGAITVLHNQQQEQLQECSEQEPCVFVSYDDSEAGVFRSLGQQYARTVLPVMVAAMAHHQDQLIQEQRQTVTAMALGSERDFDGHEFTLPSNYAWRTQIYLKLLARQKVHAKMKMDDPDFNADHDIGRGPGGVLHDWNIIPAAPKLFCAPNSERLLLKERPPMGPGPITWTVSDLAKAGSLLLSPPLPVRFEDEQEMRRVYTLIFDVYRYKGILNNALNDVSFFGMHPEMESCTSRVWLLLFDMYHRLFKKRDPKHAVEAQLSFGPAQLLDVERVLWQQRVKLAASVARLRIKNSALRLNELLPAHLRDERVQSHAQKSPVTCWVNYRKIKNVDDINAIIQRALKLKCLEDSEGTLTPGTFKWDSHCPSFLLFHPSLRTKLAQSSLVQTNKLIVQDRSFSFGPATFDKILTNLQLTGNVVQSHVNSPKTTAYLASLLSYNEKIKKLLAFSAGSRKSEYENYFNELGLKNVSTYAEKLSDVPVNAHFLEEVIAVFATPPNSYTAVTDPIDLVCSRGGDLSMLEVLTESADTSEGRQRVLEILNEQRSTLKFAMARPQIQLVLYETHSELDAENNAMIQKTVKEINQLTRMYHANLQGKLRRRASLESLDEEGPEEELEALDTNEDDLSIMTGVDEVVEEILEEKLTQTPAATQIEEDFYKDIVVPECDIFDVPSIPELCNMHDCVNISEQGCFLALIQRKEVTKLDNKYMIQMAETRGLFGESDSKTSKKKSSRRDKIKKSDTPAPQPKKRKGKAIEKVAESIQSSKKFCVSIEDNFDPFASYVTANYSYCDMEMQKLAFQLELDVKTKSTVKKLFNNWRKAGKNSKLKKVNKKDLLERLSLGTQSSINRECKTTEEAQFRMGFKK